MGEGPDTLPRYDYSFAGLLSLGILGHKSCITFLHCFIYDSVIFVFIFGWAQHFHTTLCLRLYDLLLGLGHIQTTVYNAAKLIRFTAFRDSREALA